MNNSAYKSGSFAARAQYGLGDGQGLQRMPDGPEHLGATRFVRALEDDKHESPREARKHKLERETVWGPESSVESGGVSNYDMSLRSGAV